MTDFSAINAIPNMSPDEYADFLRYCEFLHFTGLPELSESCIGYADKLVCGRLLFGKKKAVQSIAGHFCSEVPNFSLVFVPYLKEKAYVLDSGRMKISAAFMNSASGKRLFKVLMHEISHELLLLYPNYRALLFADRLFMKKYGRKALNVSPVEFCATCLGCDLIALFSGKVSERAERKMLNIISEEKEKVYACMKHILKTC